MNAKTVVSGLALLVICATGALAQATPPPAQAARAAKPATLALPDMPLHDPWIVADPEARRARGRLVQERRLGAGGPSLARPLVAVHHLPRRGRRPDAGRRAQALPPGHGRRSRRPPGRPVQAGPRRRARRAERPDDLDGTLHVDPQGKPWFVYAHEWLQTTDGTIEALPVTDDLVAVCTDRPSPWPSEGSSEQVRG